MFKQGRRDWSSLLNKWTKLSCSIEDFLCSSNRTIGNMIIIAFCYILKLLAMAFCRSVDFTSSGQSPPPPLYFLISAVFQAPIWIKPNSLSHFLVGSVSVGEKGEKLVRRNVNLLENLHCYSFFLCCTIHFIKCYTSHIVGIEVGCSVNVSLTWFLEKD